MKKYVAMLLLAGATCANAATAMFGSPDCGSWLNTPLQTHKMWLAGYLSGMNILWNGSGDPLNQLNNAQQFIAWMDNYCRAHPLNMVSDGGLELYLELVNRLPKK